LVDITFKYSEHMTKALRDYQLNSFRFWISNAIGLAIALVEFILYLNSSNERMLWIALIVLALLAVTYFMSTVAQPRKAASDPRYDKPFTLSIGELDLRLSSADLDSPSSWNDIRKVWETANFYYLFLDASQFWIAPKSAFESREQEQKFRELANKYHVIRKGLIR